jgi:uncharacterized membrane-anchored protein YhcB (DUF1043 family)
VKKRGDIIMPEENPLEKLLNQIADLFKMIEDAKGKPISERVTPEIRERLDKLKELVDKYAQVNAEFFHKAGVKEEDLQKTLLSGSSNLSPKQQKVIDFSKRLKKEVEQARRQLIVAKPEDKLIYNQDKQNASDIAKRKKKFKRMGGGGNWVPL